MNVYRTIVTFTLVMVTALLVSCGAPTETTIGPTYSSAQIEQIQKSVSRLQLLRDRMPELEPLIDEQNWTEVKAFIRGPLGELGIRMSGLKRSLAPSDQPEASRSIASLSDHLIKLDQAADTGDVKGSLEQYQSAIEDFDTLLQLGAV